MLNFLLLRVHKLAGPFAFLRLDVLCSTIKDRFVCALLLSYIGRCWYPLSPSVHQIQIWTIRSAIDIIHIDR
jgi:hypothetical protein